MNTLFALRIFGPIHLCDLADRLKQETYDLSIHLCDLAKQGLANYPTRPDHTWSVTEAGRRMVDHHEVEVTAVRRDEQRACVGVAK